MKKNSVLDSTPVALVISIAAACVLISMAVPSSAQQAEEKAEKRWGEVAESETPQYLDLGPKGCEICHGAKKITVIEQTPHGNASNPNSPWAQKGCESCHGPASLHVSRSGGTIRKENIRRFGPGGSPAPQQVAACLDCHAKPMGEQAGMKWKGSVHGKLGFTCSTCHEVHAADDPMANREKQAAKCYTCHGKQKTEHPRFEAQGIVFDKLACWNCHNVHELEPQKKSSWIDLKTLARQESVYLHQQR